MAMTLDRIRLLGVVLLIIGLVGNQLTLTNQWLSLLTESQRETAVLADNQTIDDKRTNADKNETTSTSSPASTSSTSTSSLSIDLSSTSSTTRRTPTVDILSVGSKLRADLQQAQRDTIGSHVAVRHFAFATEDDDWDQACHHNNMTFTDDVRHIVHFCKHRKYVRKPLRFIFKRTFATERFLAMKHNPVGWLCAQVRPIVVLYNHLIKYRHDLPDYLIILDDDSFIEVEALLRYFDEMGYIPDKPLALAGCRVRLDINKVNYTFPFGGFGMVQSKASLERYLWPIRCNNNKNNSAVNGTARPPNRHITSSTRDRDFQEFQQNACSRIAVDQFDERFIFREGYSVLQMLRTLATFQKFSDHKGWRQGFCFHSDWIWGYFVNYYNIASQVSDPRFVNVPESRMEAFRESELFNFIPELRRACNNDAPSPEKCNETSVVCHYQTPESMNRVINATRMMYPDRYRTLSSHERRG